MANAAHIVTLTDTGARSLTGSVLTLHSELSMRFGDERAWEFILAFYKGAGSIK